MVKIKFIREKLNLSMATLGEMVGYSGVHISRIEKGISKVPPGFLDNICSALQIDKAYFDDDVAIEDLDEYLTGEIRVTDGVGKRLREVRNERGLNIKQLSELSGVDLGLISKIENHDKTLTMKQGKKIAETLEVGLDWLMYGDEEKKDYPVDGKMEAWLWKHKDVRKRIREDMKKVDRDKDFSNGSWNS